MCDIYWNVSQSQIVPPLLSTEIKLCTVEDCTVFHGDKKMYRHGTVTLTSHRLFWTGRHKKQDLGLALELQNVESVDCRTPLLGKDKALMTMRAIHESQEVALIIIITLMILE